MSLRRYAGSDGVRLAMGAIFGVSSHQRQGEGGDDMGEFLRHGRPNDENGARELTAPDFGGVGEHVTGVLAAAEAAAARLRVEAKKEARAVLRHAEREAQEERDRAGEEIESARLLAQQLLDEAQSAGADVRMQADRYAEERKREADAQAAKAVLDAERKAAAIAETSDERHRVLLANIATSEARLRDLAKSLRRVASALDTVVVERAPDEKEVAHR